MTITLWEFVSDTIGYPGTELEPIFAVVAAVILLYAVRYILMMFGMVIKFFGRG